MGTHLYEAAVEDLDSHRLYVTQEYLTRKAHVCKRLIPQATLPRGGGKLLSPDTVKARTPLAAQHKDDAPSRPVVPPEQLEELAAQLARGTLAPNPDMPPGTDETTITLDQFVQLVPDDTFTCPTYPRPDELETLWRTCVICADGKLRAGVGSGPLFGRHLPQHYGTGPGWYRASDGRSIPSISLDMTGFSSAIRLFDVKPRSLPSRGAS